MELRKARISPPPLETRRVDLVETHPLPRSARRRRSLLIPEVRSWTEIRDSSTGLGKNGSPIIGTGACASGVTPRSTRGHRVCRTTNCSRTLSDAIQDKPVDATSDLFNRPETLAGWMGLKHYLADVTETNIQLPEPMVHKFDGLRTLRPTHFWATCAEIRFKLDRPVSGRRDDGLRD